MSPRSSGARLEDRLGATPVVLLGENLWKRRFSADPQVVGQHLTLNGRDYAVIGVVPSNVRIARINSSFADEVFTPLSQYERTMTEIIAVSLAKRRFC